MNTYARINAGAIAEIIAPVICDDGNVIPVEMRFHPDFVESLVDVSGEAPAPQIGWSYAGGMFSAPAAPTAAELLVGAKSARNAAIDAAYSAAVQRDVPFKTAAGVAQTFQADTDSQTILSQATQGYRIAGAVPENFFWKAADNTLVPFKLADLEGLYLATLAQGWVAFQKRAALKEAVDAATTVAAVQQVVFAEVDQ